MKEDSMPIKKKSWNVWDRLKYKISIKYWKMTCPYTGFCVK